MARWASLIKENKDERASPGDPEKVIKGALGLYLNSKVAPLLGGTAKVGSLPGCGLALVRWGYEQATA